MINWESILPKSINWSDDLAPIKRTGENVLAWCLEALKSAEENGWIVATDKMKNKIELGRMIESLRKE